MNFKTISPAYPLVLASSSPRRKSLLRQMKFPLRILTSDFDENQVSTQNPEDTACLLAKKKAMTVADQAAGHWILGADTMVVLGKNILGKPADRKEARSMLSSLGGKEHRVITGFCILSPTSRVAHMEAVTTLVRMKHLNPQEIEAYLDTKEPFGKAGSYAIQGIGGFLVESISGSYTNVVGLPVCALITCLMAVGALEAFPFPPSEQEH